MNFLVNRCRRRARLTEELVEEVWLKDHRGAMQSYDVEEAICECLDLGRLLRHAWGCTIDNLYRDRIRDIDGAYPVMLMTMDRAIETVRRLAESADQCIKTGYSINRYQELKTTALDLEQLKLEIEKTWPKADHQQIADALAAYHRGDFITSEDFVRESEAPHSGSGQ